MRRSGVTMIEVLVAIGVIALCGAMIAPALMYSRATARRIQCQSHLRQIGMASEGFVSSHQSYSTKYPAYWRLLSFLGQTELQQSLFEFANRNGNSRPTLSVPTFICPEDAVPRLDKGDYNYHYSDGPCFRSPAATVSGFRSDGKERRPADLSDGLSTSAMMSERLCDRPPDSLSALPPKSRDGMYRAPWYSPAKINSPGQEAEFARICRDATTAQSRYAVALANSSLLAPSFGGYDHLLPPNHRSYLNGPLGSSVDIDNSTYPANSLHSGGVNVLFADGHVAFVSESIHATLWNALGTINGNDTLQH